MADKKAKQLKIGWAHAFRDIFIASINKGQFPLALVGLCFVIFLLRAPAEALGKFGDRLLDGLEGGSYLGWGLFVATVALWSIIGKLSRRARQNEVRRIGEEKSKLQERLAGKSIKSSKKNR